MSRGLFLLLFVDGVLSASPLIYETASKKLTDDDSRTNYTKIFGKSAIKTLIESAGFGYEKYSVTTEDNYILNLNRIVDVGRSNADRGYPILLINGYSVQSEAWLVQHRKGSNIGIVWASLGYDVWLGDQRGTMRSRNHVNLTVKDDKFWDFSIDEAGLYDTAAFTDFILQKTGHKNLILSCISLGCAFHAILISERPSYNEKIRGAIYFAPMVNNIRKTTEMSSLIQVWFLSCARAAYILETQGVQDMFPYWGNLRKELFHLCQIMPTVHARLWRLVYGPYVHIPASSICYMAALSMGGTNMKTTKHVLQIYKTGDFSKYDYGLEENVRRYKTELPPLYNLTQITSFVAVYYSDTDIFYDTEGIKKTRNSLGGKSYGCRMPGFNHLDVALGYTFKYVFPDVNEVLNALSGYKNNTEKLNSGKCPSMEWIRGL